jgi:acyl carrier protein
MAIEDEFGIEISDDDVAGRMPTVKHILDYVDLRLAGDATN